MDRALALAERIRDGEDVTIQGCDFLRTSRLFGVKELGAISALDFGLFGYDIVFWKKDDGSIAYDTLVSAQILPAEKARRIVAHAKTFDKYVSSERMASYPRLAAVLEQLRHGLV